MTTEEKLARCEQKIKALDERLTKLEIKNSLLQESVNSLEEYRNSAIKADLNNGMKGVDAAKKYDLSPGRISQIKNSDNKERYGSNSRRKH